MNRNELRTLTRRRLLSQLAAGGAAFTILPSGLRGASAPSKRVHLAMIGTGRQGIHANLRTFLGMLTFTVVAAFISRRLAFLGAFAMSFLTTVYVFNNLDSAADAYWMLPLMGFAQLSLFAGYAIYFPELFPTKLRGVGVGMDVYNLEAEALGSTVTYYEGDDTSIPGIGAGDHALKFGDDLSRFKVPNPLGDGRMPINLEVSRRIARLNSCIPVRGAVSGPFSLALSLLGPEDFFMGTLDNPNYRWRALAGQPG